MNRDVVTEPRAFDLYLGIDWSGAKGNRHKGIQIAATEPGDAPPRLLRPTTGRYWSRLGVLDMLERTIEGDRRVLIGMDFATAYEWSGARAYFPGTDVDEPADALALWALVDRLAADAPDLYGAAIYQRTDVDYHRHFMWQGGGRVTKGDLYRLRQRACERACKDVTTPHPVFKCVGAANVGTGSLAGMRFLHHLKRRLGERIALWPFEPEDRDRSVVVETFPRRFFLEAGADSSRNGWGDPEVVSRMLGHHGSRPMLGPGGTPFVPASEDEADAIAIAAALRPLSAKEFAWRPPSMTEDARRYEGWIFGVE